MIKPCHTLNAQINGMFKYNFSLQKAMAILFVFYTSSLLEVNTFLLLAYQRKSRQNLSMVAQNDASADLQHLHATLVLLYQCITTRTITSSRSR